VRRRMSASKVTSPEPKPDLGKPTRLHIVGVGGSGMSAIAEVLVRMGHQVSGSDLKPSSNLERLRGLGVDVRVGHDAGNVGSAQLVAISTAVQAGNVEVRAALESGVPVLRRAQVLAAIVDTRRTVAVAGTHGKTTTSSMLALALVAAGLRPSFLIGGEVNEIGSGAAWDTGEWLVVEADESDGTFLELSPEVAVLTSVEPDHLDHYGGMEQLLDAFDRYLAAAPGPTVVCADDPVADRLGRRHGSVSYGLAEHASYRMVGLEPAASGSQFSIEHDGVRLGDIHLPVPGRHNALNALGAAVAALLLGASFETVAGAMGRFAGVARRFQRRGEAAGIAFVDDYAHLPAEVRGALQAAAEGKWRRVVCVFQPHRYSRTAALGAQFADVFEDADLLVVTDVYGAGEEPRPGVSGKVVISAVLDAHPFRAAAYLPRRPELVAYLRQRLRPGDLCLTLGAGDLNSVPTELLSSLGGGTARAGANG